MQGIIRLAILLCCCLMAMAPVVQAQEYGTIQAIATVVSGLSVTGINNLNFGTVLPGIAKSVDKTDVGFAGEWRVTGQATSEITIDFNLPTELLTADSVATMMINFTATDASYEDGTGAGQLAPAGTLNPNGPGTENIGADGTFTVWIGGTVSPTISQTGGDYSADIVLIVAYTGG